MIDGVRDLDRREMFAEIKRLCQPDNMTNGFVLLREWTVYALVVAGCLGWYHWTTAQGWSIWWSVPVYLVSVFVIAVWVQNRLACLVHEASHYSLFKNRVLNEVAANLFVAFPFFGTISNYRIGHWGHHRNVNDPENDPDLHRLRKHHPRHFPVSKWRFLWEYIVLQLSPHKAFTYLYGRAAYVAFTMKHQRVRDQNVLSRKATWALRIVFFGTLFGVLTYFGWWLHFLLFWLVPLVTFYPATLFLRELGHHGNYPDNGDFTNSRVYEGYWLEREIFFPFSEQNHVLHHMFPTIPWHKMREAHAVMMRYPPYREQVVVCDGFFFHRAHDGNPSVLDLLTAPSAKYLHGRAAGSQPGEIRRETAGEVGDVAITASERIAGES